MSKFIERKERLVEAFVATISELDSKPCDEIENNLCDIVRKTRGLIYADLYRQKIDKHSNSNQQYILTSQTDESNRKTETSEIQQTLENMLRYP